MKSTPKELPDFEPLQKAIVQVKQVAHHFNESVKKFSNAQRLLSITKGTEQLLSPHRVLLQEHSVQAERRNLNGTTRSTYQVYLAFILIYY